MKDGIRRFTQPEGCCPQCGETDVCGCKPDGDPRTWGQRLEDERMEHKRDLESEARNIE